MIRRKDNQSVIGKTSLIQSAQNLTHHPIHTADKHMKSRNIPPNIINIRQIRQPLNSVDRTIILRKRPMSLRKPNHSKERLPRLPRKKLQNTRNNIHTRIILAPDYLLIPKSIRIRRLMLKTEKMSRITLTRKKSRQKRLT